MSTLKKKGAVILIKKSPIYQPPIDSRVNLTGPTLYQKYVKSEKKM